MKWEAKINRESIFLGMNWTQTYLSSKSCTLLSLTKIFLQVGVTSLEKWHQCTKYTYTSAFYLGTELQWLQHGADGETGWPADENIWKVRWRYLSWGR